jgi:rfaE bifunctional protein kinase chain/domain
MSNSGTELDRDRLEKLVSAFPQIQLLVLGDVVLDEYLYGEVDRMSPEAPVPVVHVTRESLQLGGAGNVVRNVVALGGRCSFCSLVGDDSDGELVLDLLAQLEVETNGVLAIPNRPTTRKTRVVARSQQVVRFDRETLAPLQDAEIVRILKLLDDWLRLGATSGGSVSGVILEDYGKGFFSPASTRRIVQVLRDSEIPIAVDPKGELSRYRGASLIKPNLREAEALSGITVRSEQDLIRVVDDLSQQAGGAEVVVTLGAAGMAVFEGADGLRRVPAASQPVFDVQGAGDTAIAALVLAQRAGATLVEAAVIANAAAGVVVAKTGTATASPDELLAHLPAAIEAAGRTDQESEVSR